MDWAENDSTSPAYIKNRTHYEQWESKTLYEGDIEITDMEGMPVAMIVNPIGLEVGKTYNVNWNGTTYETKAIDNDGITFIGNLDIMNGTGDTGEPFVIAEYPAEIAADNGFYVFVLSIAGDTQVALKIAWEGIVVYKIDDKYINFKKPDMKAMEWEAGYIANKTHYIENYGSFSVEFANVEGLESFVYNNTTYYKVSDKQLSKEALKQCHIGYTKGTAQNGKLDKDTITDNIQYRYCQMNGIGGCFVICDVAATNNTLNTNAQSTGTYIYDLGGYDKITITANEIVNKLDNRFLDLSNYYTITKANSYINNRLTNYYTKAEVDALISDAVAAAVSGVNE